MKAYVVSDIVG